MASGETGKMIPTVRRRATWRRAVGLLREFRYEQSDPDRFYAALATDTVELLGAVSADVCGHDLRGRLVLDVGGGPGYYRAGFAAVGARYVSVEPDPTERHAAGLVHDTTVAASGTALPFATDSIDICYSSNVAEHIPDPWAMAAEMLRVTKPGGLVVLSYTVWWGPFGGHEMGLRHYLGGARAARWYTRKHGHPPKNLYGTSLFAVTASAGLRWARTVEPTRARLVAAFGRYLPGSIWWLTRVPGLREVATTNQVLVLTIPT